MAAGKKDTRAAKGGGRRKAKAEKSALGNMQQGLRATFFGRMLLVILAAVVLLGLNLLISGNRFSTFYIITAIEILIIMAFGFVRIMVRSDE